MDKVQEERHEVLPKVIGKVSEIKQYATTTRFKCKAMVFTSHE